jgi:hypothetical protein
MLKDNISHWIKKGYIDDSMLLYKVGVENHEAKLLLDDGAAASFVDREYLIKLDRFKDVNPLGKEININLANGVKTACYGHIYLPVMIDGKVLSLFFLVMDLTCVNLLFGKPWYAVFKPVIDWSLNTAEFFYRGVVWTFTRWGDASPISVQTVLFQSDVVNSNSLPIIKEQIDCKLLSAEEWFEEFDGHPVLYVSWLLPLMNELNVNAVGMPKATGGGIQFETRGVDAIPNLSDIDPSIRSVLNDFADRFEQPPEGVPDRNGVFHRIPLEQSSKIPRSKQYRLSFAESEELKTQLKQYLDKEWIRPSTSEYGAPVLFAAKKNGRLRMCIDYRALNDITIKDVYQIPNAEDCMNQLGSAKVFSVMDLAGGYHQIPIHPDDVHKTAMSTKYGNFEWLVMPFGLTSAPATFQRMVNNIFHDLLDVCVVVYLDDVLVFSKNLNDHCEHLFSVFLLMRKHNLFCQGTKCIFAADELEYLGHVIGADGIKVDPKKISIIRDWPVPKDRKELRSFVGLCNYYRRFIHNFAKITAPLTILFGKVDFVWNDERQDCFEKLKLLLTTAPVLVYPDPSREFHLFFDSSSTIALGGVLCQLDELELLHPVAFESRKLSMAEVKYPVHELETLAFVHCLKKWRHYLDLRPFFVYTDNRSVETVLTNRNPSLRLIRWIDWLQSYKFTIRHIPRRLNIVADLLSKCEHASLPTVEDATLDFTNIQLDCNAIRTSLKISWFDEQLFTLCREHYENDSFWKPIVDMLSKTSTPFEFDVGDRRGNFALGLDLLYEDGLLWEHGDMNRLIVPSVNSVFEYIMSVIHDSPFAGHGGVDKTTDQFNRYFVMENSARMIRDYVKHCDSCQRVKVVNRKPSGLLKPLDIPTRRWSHVSMDFVVHLPKTKNGFDSLFVVVDRFTKRAHFIPHYVTDTAANVAFLFFKHVIALHGLPLDIVSDRDSRFCSDFWSELMKLLKVSLSMGSAMHPQTDGQTERTNRTIEEMLRHYVNTRLNDWDILLPACEFAYNSSIHASVGMSPFEADIGYVPRSFFDFAGEESHNATVKSLVDRLDQIDKIVRSKLRNASARMKKYADKNRISTDIKVGDLVLLDRSHLSIDAYNMVKKQKFLPKWIGPFLVLKRIGTVSYKLELPIKSRAHDVFHESALRKYELKDGKSFPRPEPVIVEDGTKEFEVEEILNKRKRKKKIEYLVKWKGYPLHDATWEPFENVKDLKALDEFEELNVAFALCEENVTVSTVNLRQLFDLDRFDVIGCGLINEIMHK